MIKFTGKILQFGFGAVGKSFFEKVSKEINFNEYNYIVLTRDSYEFEAFINMGGISTNFHVCDINKDNFIIEFSKYLSSGDILIDFADTVGTRDICKWCAENNIMYLNTGEADWPDNWYSIFKESLKKKDLRNLYKDDDKYNNYPIVLQHGNNPGLVSHFVKAALERIILKQFPKDKGLKILLKEKRFNEIARSLGLRMIHVNDIDLQKIKDEYKEDKLVSTWCVDSFFFELLSEAAQNLGTHEVIETMDDCNMVDLEKGFFEYKKLACDMKCSTYYPGGYFEGYLVPHEETITIADSLSVIEDGKVVYRPSVMFIYSPCDLTKEYLEKSRTNDKTDDVNVVRGHFYPKDSEIAYQEMISEGCEYVGVLLVGEKFKPIWVGNRVEMSYLYKNKRNSYWQTPTITPVACSALAALSWMLKNKDKGGIYFPDDIDDYKYILKIAEKYISKTIYKTFDKKFIEDKLNIKLDNIRSKDFVI